VRNDSRSCEASSDQSESKLSGLAPARHFRLNGTMASPNIDPAKWAAAFATSRSGTAALRLLNDVYAHDSDPTRHRWVHPLGVGEIELSLNQMYLLRRVLEACFNAYKWAEQASDPGSLQRAKDQQFEKERTNIARHLKTIQRSLATYPHQWNRLSLQMGNGGAFWSAPLGKSGEEIDKLSEAHRATEIALTALLNAVPVSKGPWLHRFTFGCLHFSVAREGNSRPIAADTPLLFQLVFLFRRFSLDPAAFAGYQMGERMPSAGKPHYAVAAAFAKAVHGIELDGKKAAGRIKQLLDRNPEVGIFHWPQEN
jgi:hypothetical protein